jgi:prefoldin alpha subunit
MAEEQEIRAQYAQLVQNMQSLEADINRIQSNLQLFQAQENRLVETTIAVSELKRHKSGDEVMVSIGPGVHLHVKLSDISNVIVALGAGFAAEKPLDEALASFEQQRQQLVEIANHHQDLLREAYAKYEATRNTLSKLSQLIN